jgi:hypothetical protein
VLVTTWKRLALTGLSAMAFALLAGCGGGGDGGAGAGGGGLGATTSATPTPVFTFAFTPATSVAPGTTVTSSVVNIVGFGRTLSATANGTLIRNGTRIGPTALFQDGDKLQVESQSPIAGQTAIVTVKLDTMTEFWKINSRASGIGAYFSGHSIDPGSQTNWLEEVDTRGQYFAVPFTPAQAFRARYGAIQFMGGTLPEFQPMAQTAALYTDAQGVPGVPIAVTNIDRSSLFAPYYVPASGPVLGGGTCSPNSSSPQAQFGTEGVPLAAGTRYWLVQYYPGGVTGGGSIVIADTARVTTGPFAKQSTDGTTWVDWGVPVGTGASSQRYMPGFFLSYLAN